MKRALTFVLAMLAVLWIGNADSNAQEPVETGNTITAADAPYGYVELPGPMTYRIVRGDTLWDLAPNDWRQLQAANPQLGAAWRTTEMPSGLYRVHLTVDEPIEIPAGMTIRVRLERPSNFVEDPERNGQPFVPGGVNLEQPDAIRENARQSALRDFTRANGINSLRPEDFEIVGNIEHGRLYGPGSVYFADRPNEARTTIYKGELGYRATVRNRRTGQEQQQMFLAACGNDARQGQFLHAGVGFLFAPNGTIPGNPAPPPAPSSRMWLWILLGLAAAMLVIVGLTRPEWFGGILSTPTSIVPNTAAVASTATTVPEATPSSLHLVAEKEDVPIATLELLGAKYEAAANSGLRVVEGRDGKYRAIANGEITVTLPPRTRPRRIRKTAASTDEKAG